MSGFSRQFPKTKEDEVSLFDGYVALDSSSNVVPTLPSAVKPTAGVVYSRLKGAQKTLPVHTSTGVYTVKLDDPAIALIGFSLTPGWTNHSITNLVWSVKANVSGSATGTTAGLVANLPGNDPSIAPQTVVITFTTISGTLTDPPEATGFWISLTLKTTIGGL